MDGIDPGIQLAVDRLRSHHIETFESCEGSAGHAFPEPTVRFHGGPHAGWQALSVCLVYDLPVSSLRRVWDVLDRNEPTGPHWELTFRHRMPALAKDYQPRELGPPGPHWDYTPLPDEATP